LSVPLVAGVLALVWWAPWSSSPDPVARARAAFGDQRVVHAVTRPTTLRSTPLRPLMTVQGEELWYDEPRDRIHVVAQEKGAIRTDRVGRPGPATTPALAFVLHYRSDLADGKLRDGGSDVVQNRAVIWLRASAYRVAVDPVSYEPLWVAGNGPDGSTQLVQLVVAETKPFDPADFLTAKQKKPRHL
jgi:hypothetical protein